MPFNLYEDQIIVSLINLSRGSVWMLVFQWLEVQAALLNCVGDLSHFIDVDYE